MLPTLAGWSTFAWYPEASAEATQALHGAAWPQHELIRSRGPFRPQRDQGMATCPSVAAQALTQCKFWHRPRLESGGSFSFERFGLPAPADTTVTTDCEVRKKRLLDPTDSSLGQGAGERLHPAELPTVRLCGPSTSYALFSFGVCRASGSRGKGPVKASKRGDRRCSTRFSLRGTVTG